MTMLNYYRLHKVNEKGEIWKCEGPAQSHKDIKKQVVLESEPIGFNFRFLSSYVAVMKCHQLKGQEIEVLIPAPSLQSNLTIKSYFMFLGWEPMISI